MADLKESDLFPDFGAQKRHWYYHYKIGRIRLMLERQLAKSALWLDRSHGHDNNPCLSCLDIGAGNGIISRSLGNRIGSHRARWDLVDSAYNLDHQEPDAKDPSFRQYLSIPADASYDVVIAIDVLEHVQDERGLLRLVASHMSPGSILVICVPAFQMLWSAHDVFLEHCRRYRRKRLVRLLREEGFAVNDSGYLYVLLFPVVAIARLVKRLSRLFKGAAGQHVVASDMRIYSTTVNRFLGFVMTLERELSMLAPPFSFLPGVSCFAVATKTKALSASK